MIFDFKNLAEKYNCNINGILHVGAHHGEEYNLYKQFDINPIVSGVTTIPMYEKIITDVRVTNQPSTNLPLPNTL